MGNVCIPMLVRHYDNGSYFAFESRRVSKLCIQYHQDSNWYHIWLLIFGSLWLASFICANVFLKDSYWTFVVDSLREAISCSAAQSSGLQYTPTYFAKVRWLLNLSSVGGKIRFSIFLCCKSENQPLSLTATCSQFNNAVDLLKICLCFDSYSCGTFSSFFKSSVEPNIKLSSACMLTSPFKYFCQVHTTDVGQHKTGTCRAYCTYVPKMSGIREVSTLVSREVEFTIFTPFGWETTFHLVVGCTRRALSNNETVYRRC